MSRKSDMAVRAAALDAGRSNSNAESEIEAASHPIRDIIVVAGAAIGVLLTSSIAVLLYLA